MVFCTVYLLLYLTEMFSYSNYFNFLLLTVLAHSICILSRNASPANVNSRSANFYGAEESLTEHGFKRGVGVLAQVYALVCT